MKILYLDCHMGCAGDMLTAALYAATDEVHQLFVPGRSGQVSDVLLDSAGAIAGLALLGGIRFLVQRRWDNDGK